MTQDQLFDLGFRKSDDGFYYNDDWEYQFNSVNNELVFYNDGFPDDEPVAIIKNYEHFKQVLKLLTQNK